MNPNKLKDNKLIAKINEFSDHYTHCEYIWNEFISRDQLINNISIIAHKNSSISLIKLMKKYSDDFKYRVKNIFLINSIHNNFYKLLDTDLQIVFQKVIIYNFRKPLITFFHLNQLEAYYFLVLNRMSIIRIKLADVLIDLVGH